MKNADLYRIKQVIKEVKDKGTNKFKLSVIRNEMKVDGYIKALEELRKPSDKIEEFYKQRNALLSEHAETDGGSLVVYTESTGAVSAVLEYSGARIAKRKYIIARFLQLQYIAGAACLIYIYRRVIGCVSLNTSWG